MEFYDLGERCFVCNRQDYMPIECFLCHKHFCSDHSSLTAHNCDNVINKKREKSKRKKKKKLKRTIKGGVIVKTNNNPEKYEVKQKGSEGNKSRNCCIDFIKKLFK